MPENDIKSDYLGHRVISAWMKRVTSADAFDAKPTAFENTIFHYRLRGIFAAGRFEAAIIAKHGREKPLIHSNQKNKYAPHNSSNTHYTLHITHYTPHPLG